MNFRLIKAAIVLLMSLLALSVCSCAFAATIKIATLSPDGSSWMKELRKGAEIISVRTEGRVKFKFYPGGVMGDDKAVLRKMRFGQLHGATFTNGSLHHYYPDVQVYNLVLKFHNLDEVDYVRARMDSLIIQGLENKGLVTFGLAEIGFAYLFSQQPIASVDDIRQRKAWVPDGNRIALEAVSAFDVAPIPLPIRDVMVALQTGMVDTVAGSAVGVIALQWHTQVKYLTDLPLSYVYGVLAVDQKAFDKIEARDQPIVREVMAEVTRKLDTINRADNLNARAALEKTGMEFLQPTPQAELNIRNLVASANHNLITAGRLSDEMVELLEVYLAEFRAQPAAVIVNPQP